MQQIACFSRVRTPGTGMSLLSPPLSLEQASILGGSAFAAGRHRPEGTLVEHTLDERRSMLTASGKQLTAMQAEQELRKMEADLAAGDAEAAFRRFQTFPPSKDLPEALLAQVHFLIGRSCVALSRLEAAERWFGSSAAALERAAGPSEPALLPCLLNRGVVLVRLGRHKPAAQVCWRARARAGHSAPCSLACPFFFRCSGALGPSATG